MRSKKQIEKPVSFTFLHRQCAFFSSKVLPTVYGGRYFITSEQDGKKAHRTWTVCLCRDDGIVERVPGRERFRSRPAAVRFVKHASLV